jgi:type IV pilus biogenesis protein PilP
MKAQQLTLCVLVAIITINAQGVDAVTAEDDPKAAVSGQRSTPTYDELSVLRGENAILAERLKNVELRNKIEAAKGTPPASTGPATPVARSRTSGYVDHGARVQMVSGVAGNLSATVQLSDGGNTIARVGSRIPNVGRVKSIKTDEVLVENGKEMVSIPFAVEPVSNAQYSAPYVPAAGAMVPPLSLPPGRN